MLFPTDPVSVSALPVNLTVVPIMSRVSPADVLAAVVAVVPIRIAIRRTLVTVTNGAIAIAVAVSIVAAATEVVDVVMAGIVMPTSSTAACRSALLALEKPHQNARSAASCIDAAVRSAGAAPQGMREPPASK